MSEPEEDFLDDLEADLGDSSEEVLADDEGDELQALQRYIDDYQPMSLSNYESLNPQTLSLLPLMKAKVAAVLSMGKNITVLLSILNSLSHIAQTDSLILGNYMKLLYKNKFNELETLVPSPLQYATVIHIIETGQGQLERDAQLSKEQLLVLNMSMKMSFHKDQFVDNNKLMQARDLLVSVTEMRAEMNKFILARVQIIAPNTGALVGPEIASLLLSYAGGIVELSQIPSCNLASIGKSRHLSHEFHTNIGGVRQEGYIYHSALVQERPVEFRKQMSRMVCAKVALSSRVDAGGAKDNALGNAWKEQLLQKIRKIQEPPNISKTKPLPVPEDIPKKKRAGRKFRKYKQQFQLSHLRQLQNRMEFGKTEQSIIDDTGEEIGLGMASSLRGVPVAANNGAKMTKSMRRKIGEANEQANTYMRSLDENNIAPSEPKGKGKKASAGGGLLEHHSK